MQPAEIKIVLVDDHGIVREGLRRTLTEQKNLKVVGEAANGKAALECIRAMSPDLAIFDVKLGEESGIELARKVTTEFPSVKIIMLTAHFDLPTVTAALQTGVSGYVTKDSRTEELLRAISTVMDHRTYLCPEIASLVVGDYMKTLSDKVIVSSKPILTDRDRLLLKLVADGKRNKEIAGLLDIQPKSVETYRARLMKKLGCASTSELVRYAIREGVVTP